jgi:hypothetical protein
MRLTDGAASSSVIIASWRLENSWRRLALAARTPPAPGPRQHGCCWRAHWRPRPSGHATRRLTAAAEAVDYSRAGHRHAQPHTHARLPTGPSQGAGSRVVACMQLGDGWLIHKHIANRHALTQYYPLKTNSYAHTHSAAAAEHNIHHTPRLAAATKQPLRLQPLTRYSSQEHNEGQFYASQRLETILVPSLNKNPSLPPACARYLPSQL